VVEGAEEALEEAALGGGVAIAGAILALTLGGGGNDHARRAQGGGATSVRTVTAKGATIRETITKPAPPAPPPPAATGATTPLPPAPGIAGSGHTLNDRGYALMRAGNYNAALPLLQNAVRKLRGSGPGDAYEAYANYNLGYTLLQLHRCRDAVSFLQRAQQLEPQRAEPGQQLARAQACS
jgi:TolA-binding protein